MTVICAHRGASGFAPENTLGALELAISQGATMAEIDVQLSADGQAVVIHDETLDRTTSGTGPVARATYSHLRTLDAGSWYDTRWRCEQVPSLEEVLHLAQGRLTLNLELKGAAGPALEQEALRLIRDHGFADHCLLTSFDQARIDRLIAQDTGLKLGYIIGRGAWQAGLLDAAVQVLSVERTVVDEELISAAHQAGKEVHVWTVNEADERDRLTALGADVIITNYPGSGQAGRDPARGC